MQLSTLLKEFIQVPHQANLEIADLALDSRKIKPNDLFLAIRGTQFDGREYIADAISRGACAVLVDTEVDTNNIVWHEQIPLLPIKHLAAKTADIAARFYNFPAKKLHMLGVTGTNGKTSCTHFIAQSLASLEIQCGIIGTLGNGFYGALGEAGLTTPDAITLQSTLRNFYQQGASAIAMEVSSHSIAQGRVNNIDFELGIFTNLTQDHLDYHGDMETYAAVKHKFLSQSSTKNLIINADDPRGIAWTKALAKQKQVYAYACAATHVEELKANNIPCVYVKETELTFQGINTFVYSPWGEGPLTIPLIGQFNLSNALAVLTALCAYGIKWSDVLDCIARLKPVPGRMQTLGGGSKPLVIVDYSHTPDALEKVLQALRHHTSGQLICVFGCGGDRDQGKRPLMAKIAEQWADKVIVTNDNPRHEKPEVIAQQILQGFAHPERVTVMLDRSKAIENSIQLATAKDCVLIAGKGAEHYQQIGDEKLPFDDVEQAAAYLDK